MKSNLIRKHANTFIDRVLLPALIIGPLSVSGLFGFCQPAIKQPRLETVLQEEKGKLGIKDDIEIVFGETPSDSFAQIEPVADEYGEITGYKITLDEMRSRFAVRHELYHLVDKHLVDYFGSDIRAELQANMYALIGVRL